MSSKNPGQKSPCSEAKVICSDTNTAKETNCKLLRPSTRTKSFFLILNSATPIQLRFKELTAVWWFLYNTSVSEQENYQSSDLFHRSSFCRCKLNIGSIIRCTFQIFHGDVKIVQNERKRRIVIDRDGRLTLKLCLLTMSSFEFNFHSFKLRLSLDPDLIHISIKKVLFDRQKALSRILESTIAFVRFRYRVFLKFCLMNLFFELVVARSFFVWVARVIKSTSRRKASTECHIINNLLTALARAVLPRSQANIPQNGPCARLVSG